MHLNLEVHMRFDDLDHAVEMTDGRTRNVSREGLFIVTEDPKPVGTAVRIMVSLGSESFSLNGVVVRQVPDPDDTRPKPAAVPGNGIFIPDPPHEWSDFCERLEQRRFEKDGLDVGMDDD
jgi:hypothetical protein